MTVPNRIIPRIEYMNMKSNGSPRMLARDCSVITKMLKMRLRGRRMRKERRIVMTPLISSDVLAEMKMLTKEPRMITVSKMFQPSEKYTLGAMAIILMTASEKKIAVKI
jgi:hypothetical protein